MDIAFFVVAFAGVFLAMFRSLGWGFLAVIAVGYVSGVIRANYLGVFTAFMFDAAVFGLYLGFLLGKARWAAGGMSRTAVGFVLFMIAWPTFLCLVPVNHFLVQCVALRAAIWFLPVLLIATRLTTADLALLTRGLVVLNLVALAVGVYLYLYGIEVLYPVNAVTGIIYCSKDLGGSTKYYRVPSLFLNAHVYGGAMLYTLPFLFDRLAGVKVRLVDRWLAVAGMVAAGGGLLMCGARYPLVVLGLTLLVAWVMTRLSLKLALLAAVLGWVGLFVARNDERLQRVTSLGDSESVSQRVAGSANEGFLEILIYYPFGRGMGSANGTNIPFFLAHLAPEQFGLENEFCRILVDQGWFGLAGWLALVGWLCARPPSGRSRAPWWLGVVFMYSLTLSWWATSFIGTGLLTSIPGTFLLLTEMGVLVTVRGQGAVPEAVSIRPGAPCGFSSPLPLCGEGPEWESVETLSGPVGGIGLGYPPPWPTPARGKGDGIPCTTKVSVDQLGKPSPSKPEAPDGVCR